MVFDLCGIVKWKGKKIANGINGRFETNDERVIERLKMLGFSEIKENPVLKEDKPKKRAK